jgi:hypothetical protein
MTFGQNLWKHEKNSFFILSILKFKKPIVQVHCTMGSTGMYKIFHITLPEPVSTKKKFPEATSLEYTRLSVSLNILFRYNLPMRNHGYIV